MAVKHREVDAARGGVRDVRGLLARVGEDDLLGAHAEALDQLDLRLARAVEPGAQPGEQRHDALVGVALDGVERHHARQHGVPSEELLLHGGEVVHGEGVLLSRDHLLADHAEHRRLAALRGTLARSVQLLAHRLLARRLVGKVEGGERQVGVVVRGVQRRDAAQPVRRGRRSRRSRRRCMHAASSRRPRRLVARYRAGGGRRRRPEREQRPVGRAAEDSEDASSLHWAAQTRSHGHTRRRAPPRSQRSAEATSTYRVNRDDVPRRGLAGCLRVWTLRFSIDGGGGAGHSGCAHTSIHVEHFRLGFSYYI